MVRMSLRTAAQVLVLLVTLFCYHLGGVASVGYQPENESSDAGEDSRAALIMDASDSMMAEDIEGGGTRPCGETGS